MKTTKATKTLKVIALLALILFQGCTFKTLKIECLSDIEFDVNNTIPVYSPSDIRYLDATHVVIGLDELKEISNTSLKVRKEMIRLKYGVLQKNEIIGSCREQVSLANEKEAKYIEWWFQ